MRTQFSTFGALFKYTSWFYRNSTTENLSRTRRNLHNSSRKPLIVGIAGGAAAGKTTVCNVIRDKLINTKASCKIAAEVICQDSFYKNLEKNELEECIKGSYNFDHPDAFDNTLCHQTLKDILSEKCVQVPEYDYVMNNRSGSVKVLHRADIILLEGILIFYFKNIRDLIDIKVFVDVDADIRLSRRILRDIYERGRDLSFTLNQYLKYVKPSFEEFCLPTKKFADLIIPRGVENTVGLDLLVDHITRVYHRTNETDAVKESSVGQ